MFHHCVETLHFIKYFFYLDFGERLKGKAIISVHVNSKTKIKGVCKHHRCVNAQFNLNTYTVGIYSPGNALVV